MAYSTSNKKSLSKIARETSKETGLKINADKVKCLGCKGPTASCWGSTCKIRECADDRGMEFCYQCAEYPCDNLQLLFEKHPEAKDNLKTISKIGPDAWVSSMLDKVDH